MGLLEGVRNIVSGLSKEEVEEVERWTKKQEQEAKDDPLNHGFRPHPSQMKLHVSTAHEALFVAANRVGKSTGGMREALWRATGTHPYKEVKPHEAIWCGFPDYPFYRRTTLRIFKRWCPRNRLLSFDKTEKVAIFRRSDGGICEVFFVSYDSGRDKWQGAAVDFIWLDEECPLDIYEEAMARLVDSGGDILMTQTPVSGLGWTFDAIFLPHQQGTSQWEVIEGALAEYRPECVCEHQPEEHDKNGACGEIGCGCRAFRYRYELAVGEPLVPHFTRDKVLRFARSIKDPDMRLIRIFGKYRARAGGIYKMFNPAVHKVPAFKIARHWEVWGGIDPGFHGFAVCLLAQDPFGRIFVFYEYFSQGETTGARARELWSAIKERLPHLADPNNDDYIVLYVDTEDPQTILELNTWAQENGTRLAFAALDQGKKAVKAGIARVQEYLIPERDRRTPIMVTRERPVEGEPLIYFFDTLASTWLQGDDAVATSRLLWEMSRYLWKRKKEGQVQTDEPDKASAHGAHALDCLRYAMMARLGPPPEVTTNDEDRGGGSALDREVRKHMEELHAARTAYSES